MDGSTRISSSCGLSPRAALRPSLAAVQSVIRCPVVVRSSTLKKATSPSLDQGGLSYRLRTRIVPNRERIRISRVPRRAGRLLIILTTGAMTACFCSLQPTACARERGLQVERLSLPLILRHIFICHAGRAAHCNARVETGCCRCVGTVMMLIGMSASAGVTLHAEGKSVRVITLSRSLSQPPIPTSDQTDWFRCPQPCFLKCQRAPETPRILLQKT